MNLWACPAAHHTLLCNVAVHLPCRTVSASTLLLLDSGGQFDCGTTDITRTMHLGTPDDYQRRCYTRVLQGHIGLDRVRGCAG